MRLFQYQRLAEPVLVPAQAETVTLDKWFQPASAPVRRSLRAPASFEVGPLEWCGQFDKWCQPTSVPFRRPPRGGVPFEVGPLVVPAPAESITLDKWFREQPIPIPRSRRPTIGDGVLPPFAPAPAESITLDKWFREQPIPVPRSRRPTIGETVLPLGPMPGVPLDRWFQPIVQPRGRARPPIDWIVGRSFEWIVPPIEPGRGGSALESHVDRPCGSRFAVADVPGGREEVCDRGGRGDFVVR